MIKSEKISAFLQTKIDEGDFPSAVYLVAEKGEIVLQDALGFAVVEPEKIEAKLDTIYDLASLTKVLVTGLLCAKLIENGEINLSDKIAKYFSEFDTDEKRKITVENLLTHTSGFQAWYPFYLDSILNYGEPKQYFVFNKIASSNLEYQTNSKVVYSDFNFIILGFLIEKAYGNLLYEILDKEISQPLNLHNTFFSPLKKLIKQTAASENGNAFEKQTCIDLGYEIKYPSIFRSKTIWGEVHDNNCYYLESMAGHAGLFSNVYETLKIANQFLAESSVLLKPETCKLFRTNFTKDLNQARSIAFQLAETEDSTASEALSKDSFGHLGFTGTSLWIEPSKERIFILLTNRTHNRELPLADLKETRQNFHRIATEILDGK
ncbi:MAG: serine hydrolase domain-containing protein [Aridibacter sp.]